MSVNRMIQIGAIVFAILFASISAFVMSEVIGSGFRKLELQKAEATGERVSRFLAEQLEQLRTKNNDWTVWNELYNYAIGTAPEFAEENFTREALDALQISGLVLVNNEQKLLSAIHVNPTDRDLTPIPQYFDELRNKLGAFGPNDLKGERTGIFKISGKPMLVVARSILKGDLSGPVAGTLYFFLEINAALIEKAKHAVGIDISIITDFGSDKLILENMETQNNSFYYFEADRNPALLMTQEKHRSEILMNILAGTAKSDTNKLRDQDSTAVRLKLKYARDIMLLGGRVSTIVNTMVFILSIFGWSMFYLAIRKLLINRISDLEKIINSKETGDKALIERLSLRYSSDVVNEIDKLGATFINVLKRIISAERQRDKVRAEIMHSAKLASLGEMAGGIAHEINNPLTVILGRARQLKVLLEKNSLTQEKAESVIVSIENTTLRIARIVKSLRTHTRESENDPFLETDVRGIIEGVTELCRDQIREKRISLKIDISRTNASLNCREVQIGQVLLNLIKNAIDAVESLSEVDRWILVQVGSTDPKFAQSISVSNGGPSIPESVRVRLFQPFFTTKPVGKGTGLGLSISASILQQHKGRLRLDDASTNTMFVLEFPVLSVESSAKKEVA